MSSRSACSVRTIPAPGARGRAWPKPDNCRAVTRKAHALYLAAVAGWQAQAGHLNSKTLACRQRFGRFLLETGDVSGARRELSTAIAGYEEAFAPDHPQLHATRVDLAEVLLREGNAIAAKSLLQKAIPVLDATFGAEFELCSRARALLAQAG